MHLLTTRIGLTLITAWRSWQDVAIKQDRSTESQLKILIITVLAYRPIASIKIIALKQANHAHHLLAAGNIRAKSFRDPCMTTSDYSCRTGRLDQLPNWFLQVGAPFLSTSCSTLQPICRHFHCPKSMKRSFHPTTSQSSISIPASQFLSLQFLSAS